MRSSRAHWRLVPWDEVEDLVADQRGVLSEAVAVLQCAAVAFDNCPGDEMPDFALIAKAVSAKIDIVIDELDSVRLRSVAAGCTSMSKRYNIHSTAPYIAISDVNCWRCGNQVRVICLFCEAATVDGEARDNLVVSNMTDASESLLNVLRAYPHFRPSHSRTADFAYFANHCERCGAMQGDFYLHSEPGGAFFPESAADAARITFMPIDVPIDCEGSEGYSTAMEYALEDWRKRGSRTP